MFEITFFIRLIYKSLLKKSERNEVDNKYNETSKNKDYNKFKKSLNMSKNLKKAISNL